MLNKAVFRPFIDNVYFTRDEKKTSDIVFTYLEDENKLRIELMSAKGLYLSHEHQIDESDVELDKAGESTSIIVNYDDFVKCINKVKAKNTISLVFSPTFLLIKEIVNNEDGTIVSNMLKKGVKHTPESVIKTREMSEDVYLDSTGLENTRYLSNVKYNIDILPQFNGVTLKPYKDDILFIGTAGSALHVCNVKAGEILEGMEEYCFPSTYLKNLDNVASEYGVYLSVGENEAGNSIIRFSNENTFVQFIVQKYKKTVLDNNLQSMIELLGRTKTKFVASFLETEKTLKDFINQEKSFRSLHNVDKLSTLLSLSWEEVVSSQMYNTTMIIGNNLTTNSEHYTIDIDNAEDVKYLFTCYDLIKLLEDYDFSGISFLENENCFAINTKNKYMIIPKKKS